MRVERGLHTLLTRFINKEFLFFLIIGIANTVITYSLYLILLNFLSYFFAYTISYIVGIFCSYFLNSKFVFKAKISLKKVLKYPIVYIVQYLIGLLLVFLLVDLFHLKKELAPSIVIILTIPITYLLSKFILKSKLNNSNFTNKRRRSKL